MRAAPLKGDCIICQAPEAVRIAVNLAVWGDGTLRVANYRSAGVRAAAQAAVAADEGRYRDLDPKTITRHADHIEDSWREFNPGEQLAPDEVPVATDFGSVTESGSRLGMKAMAALEAVIDQNPGAFAALRTKEAIAIAKLGLGSAVSRETSRLKRNQQVIDVAAIFASSSGHVRPPDSGDSADEASLEELRGELEQERLQIAARAG